MTVSTEATLDFPDFTLHTLAPGIHAAIAKRFTGSVANAGIIDLGDRTLVFDTFMCVSAARDLASAAVQLTGRPATYVVNSHPHPDHVHGNIAFGDVTILATSATRADRLARGERVLGEVRQAVTGGLQMARQLAAGATDEAQRRAAQGMIGWNEAVLNGLPTPDELRHPTLTFEQQLTLHGSARSVQLLALGAGHSPSDSLLWLPAERIAFTADVVISGGHLVLDDGNPEEWLRILDDVDRLGATIIVPGHGRVQGPDATAPVRQYIIDLLELAARAARDGITPESAAQVAVPEAYQALAMPQVFTQNLAALLRRMR